VEAGTKKASLSKLEVARLERGGALVKERLEDALPLQLEPVRREGGAALVGGVSSRTALVWVGEVAATVDLQGHFVAVLPAKELAGGISVKALDVGARQKMLPLGAATIVGGKGARLRLRP
jgi:hypothetical protein